MQKTISKSISVLFHPLIMPTVGLFIFFNAGTYYDYLPFDIKRVLVILITISTFVLPITFTPFYIFQKLIKNVEMQKRKERYVPLIVTSILYLFCFYLLRKFKAPEILQSFILGSSFSILILFLSNFKWKISAHMTGIGGLTGAIFGMALFFKVNLGVFFILAILVSGLVGFSRLKLEAHKPVEVYLGWGIGFVSLFTTILIY